MTNWSAPIEGQGSAHDFATSPELVAFYRGSELIDTRDTINGGMRASRMHRFQDQSGENVDVWGSSDLDAKLKNVVPGTLTQIEFTGHAPLPPKKGETEPRSMKQFTVRIDPTTVPTTPTPAAPPPDDDIPF